MTTVQEPILTKVNISTDITEERIRNLLCGAFEGGSNYWYYDLDYKMGEGYTIEDFREKGRMTIEEYNQPYLLIPFVEGCAVIGKYEEGETFELTREKLIKGIQLMPVKCPSHWKDFINENDDAITADVFLQLCLFGEIVYG